MEQDKLVKLKAQFTFKSDTFIQNPKFKLKILVFKSLKSDKKRLIIKKKLKKEELILINQQG